MAYEAKLSPCFVVLIPCVNLYYDVYVLLWLDEVFYAIMYLPNNSIPHNFSSKYVMRDFLWGGLDNESKFHLVT